MLDKTWSDESLELLGSMKDYAAYLSSCNFPPDVLRVGERPCKHTRMIRRYSIREGGSQYSWLCVSKAPSSCLGDIHRHLQRSQYACIGLWAIEFRAVHPSFEKIIFLAPERLSPGLLMSYLTLPVHVARTRRIG